MSNSPAILGGAPAFEPFVPIVRPVLPSFDDLSEGLQNILDSRMVTRGRYLKEFEAALADHLHVRHALAVSSCTSGLILSYKGLGLTGEVIVPSFTFMATVSAMIWAGLTPVFVDVNRDTTNLDPNRVEAAITPRTSAIVAVHNFGNPAEIEQLQAIADKHHLALVFDAAHGFGARYRGIPVGGQGKSQVFSMSPTKLLIAGEGGIVSTDDDLLADQIRTGREYGNPGNYDSAFPGLNARLPEFSCLLGLQSLHNLDHAAESRNQTAELFTSHLSQLPGIAFQIVDPRDRNSYREYSITIDEAAFGLSRDQLSKALLSDNVDNRKYYDPPVHRQTAYASFYKGQPLPNTDWLANNSLSLPMWTDMDPEITRGICRAIECIHENAAAVRKQLA
jgi:dTDP-4-amino-4,6-dideoxygalactose transaminase